MFRRCRTNRPTAAIRRGLRWPLRLLRLEDRTAPATLVGLSIVNTPVSTTSNLFYFNGTNPGTLATFPWGQAVTGLGTREALQGLDFRPATGQLFGVAAVPGGTTARLGTISLATGAFTQVGPAFTVSAGSFDFGFDFNPVTDRISLVSNAGQHLLINPNDGTVTPQANLNPGTPNVVGLAYTDSSPNATTTTLLAIDSAADQLLILNPATGALSAVGGLGVDTTGAVGFDVVGADTGSAVAGSGTAFASLTSPQTGRSNLYVISRSRIIGAGLNVRDLGQIGFAQSGPPLTVRDVAVVRFVWDGGGTDANWATAANWAGDIAPTAGDDLVFPAGAARVTNTNNFPADTVFNSLTFNGPNYSITGNALQLDQGLTANVASAGPSDVGPAFSPGLTLYNPPLSLSPPHPQTFAANGARGIDLLGPVNLNGIALTVTGVAPTFVGGVVSGAGSLTKAGTGTLTLEGNNTFTGPVTHGVGTLEIRANTALGAAGAGNGTTIAPVATLLLQPIGLNPGLTVPEALSVSGAGAGAGGTAGAIQSAARTNTLTGPVTLAGDTTIRVQADSQLTVSGAITETGGARALTKTGPATLVLTSTANGYTGGTAVAEGTLRVDGAVGAVTLAGGLLGGSGTVGAVTSAAAGGTVTPGAGGPGTLNSGGVAWNEATRFAVELNGTAPGTGYDRLNVTGVVNLGGTPFVGGAVLSLSLGAGFAPPLGTQFVILSNDGTDPVAGFFANLRQGATLNASGQFFAVDYAGGTGNDVVLTRSPPPSPRVSSVQINDSAAQRSMVTSLTVRFNTLVTFAATPAAAFRLTNLAGALVNFTATAANSGGATVVMLNAFAGAQTTAGSLNDGRYVLTVLASQVAANGFQLDGDGDGTGGDNYVLSDSGQPGGLYRFFGDVTGDRFVNGADFDFFRTAFGTLSGQPNFLAAFDVNGDGIINGADFAPFRGNFGLSL